MPIYEYRCDACGKSSEELLPVAERNTPPPCSHCGKESLSLVFSGVASFNLKGMGWAKDGYSKNLIEHLHNMEERAGLRNGKGETRDIVPVEERGNFKTD